MAGLKYAPHAFITTLLRIAFGYRPELPWISYRAIRVLNRLLHPSWCVLEFGSGMSTLWLARRCAFLHSIEDDPIWYRTVQEALSIRGLSNVHHELRTPDRYSDLSDHAPASYDFILIDGSQRARCLVASLEKLKPRGWIYIDNIDHRQGDVGRERQHIEAFIVDLVKARGGKLQYFTDFSPCSLTVTQGVLVRL
jgi:predicted O-methyltransferase YrrM